MGRKPKSQEKLVKWAKGDSLHDLSRSALPTMAAYLGFQHTREFHRLLCTAPVLQAVFLFTKFLKGKPIRAATDLLAELENHLDGSAEFLGSMTELATNYEMRREEGIHEEKEDLANLAAGIIYHLAQMLQDHGALRTNTSQFSTELKDLLDGHNKEKKKGKHPFNLPDVSTVDLVLPKLGPFEEFGEHHMEKFGRVYSVIKFWQNVLSSPSRWRSFFAASKTPWTDRANRQIQSFEVPHWMSAQSRNTNGILGDIIATPVQKQQDITLVRVTVANKIGRQMRQHTEDFIEDEG